MLDVYQIGFCIQMVVDFDRLCVCVALCAWVKEWTKRETRNDMLQNCKENDNDEDDRDGDGYDYDDNNRNRGRENSKY